MNDCILIEYLRYLDLHCTNVQSLIENDFSTISKYSIKMSIYYNHQYHLFQRQIAELEQRLS